MAVSLYPKGQHALSLWDSLCLVGTDGGMGYNRSKLFIRLNISDPTQRHRRSIQIKALEIPATKLHRQI